MPTRGRAEIILEELDDEELVVRITAIPVREEDGPELADQVLKALAEVTSGDVTLEHVLAANRKDGGDDADSTF